MNITQAMQLAVKHHQAGDLAQADLLYAQVLAQIPTHPDALHLRGVLMGRMGRTDLAVELIRQAIVANPDAAEFHFHLGIALKASGQTDAAIVSYRRALELNPAHAQAHCNLGVALMAVGKTDDAIAAYRLGIERCPDFPELCNNLAATLTDIGQSDEAIALYRCALKTRPDDAAVHHALGVLLYDKGQFDDAAAAFRRVIQLNPEYPPAHSNLGNALRKLGRGTEALASYDQALRQQPGFVDAHYNRGITLMELGRATDGEAAFRQTLLLRPLFPEAHNNLGNALLQQRRFEESVAAYSQALQQRPDFTDAACNLGIALRELDEFDKAVDAYRHVLRLRPDYAEVHNNLAVLFRDQGKIDEAMTACRTSLNLMPGYVDAHCNLGVLFKDQGQFDEAIQAYRHAMELKPDDARIHTNLLYTMLFHPRYDAAAILHEHQEWNRRHAAPLAKHIRPHENNRDPNRRLRIGYIAPDFREHCQSFFTMPLLSNHDHHGFEIFCYSDVRRPDAITARLQGYADHWRDIAGMSNENVAERIRNDRIDVLVDLTMHMANGRPFVLALKPAPIQVSWLAYPGTTGMGTIDYRLTDPYLDPPGVGDEFYTERSIRFPETFWCYDPLTTEPAVNDLPALGNGYVTFGCLGNFCKINDQVLDLWARVLLAVEKSRLLLLAPSGLTWDRVVGHFLERGVDADRLERVGFQPRSQYLQVYHRIDIGLDTLPYNGHTTSLDSFWMGVPVITLPGSTVVGRAGLSQLSNLDLPELVARTPERFVEIAAELAADLPRLRQLRSTLRKRMQASPLMDGPRFARNMESAYRRMWQTWCGQPAVSS
jgi:protein O-GlcNAc transferase